MALTFILLGLSICAAWAPDVRAGAHRLQTWALLYAAAVSAGLAYRVLDPLALLPLTALLAAALLSVRLRHPVARGLLTGIAAVTALALASRAFPGFNNPVVAQDIQLSPNAPSFTQQARFDTASAGLILLVAFCRHWPDGRMAAWRQAARDSAIVGAPTIAIVIGLALAGGHIEVDPKLPEYAIYYVPMTLLVTSVTEEAFFRGLVQARLQALLTSRSWPEWPAVATASVLFGLAHARGGWMLVVLATIAGAGYGLAYARNGHIEAAILTHFGLNTVHFFGFTYPMVQG